MVLLTGSGGTSEATAQEVGADALMLKPFSPLELLAVVERVAAGLHAMPFRATAKRSPTSSCCSTPAICATCSSSSEGSAGSCRPPTTRP